LVLSKLIFILIYKILGTKITHKHRHVGKIVFYGIVRDFDILKPIRQWLL